MENSARPIPKAFTVNFAKVDRWDPNSFHGIEWHWPLAVMTPIGSVLTPRKEKVDGTTHEFADLMPVTIHFDGSIEPRKISGDKEYTMELFWARSGDIVVSKIDLKNGAVAIIPDGWDNAVVTNHFAVYKPDLDRIEPGYFHLLIQAKFFTQHLWRNKVGAEGRKEVKLDFFEALAVPVPPLPVQRKIVAYWEKAVDAREQMDEQSLKLIKDCHTSTLALLGINQVQAKPVGKTFCLNWSALPRWSYEYNKRVLAGVASMQTGRYPAKPLGDICSGVSGSTPSKTRSEYWRDGTLPWVSPKDMKARIITDSIDHISQQAAIDRQATLIDEGSILFVVRSGILQHTVPVAMTQARVSINQDMRAFTPRTKQTLPEFLLAYFEAKQDELLHLVKWSTTVQSINREELELFPIPMPPLQKQREVIATVKRLQDKIHALADNRERMMVKTEATVEQLILGTLSVEEL